VLTKTDNSYLLGKVILRELLIKDLKNINVLDTFGGEGKIWEMIKKRNLDKNINVVSIEIIKGKNNNAIVGDNLKIIPKMDLSDFDVIDIDAYGSPFKQLKAIIDNGSYKNNVIIFTTDIFVMQGRPPNELLSQIGITKNMIKKIPTLFIDFNDRALFDYLYKKGVRKIFEYRPIKNKKYRGFILHK